MDEKKLLEELREKIRQEEEEKEKEERLEEAKRSNAFWSRAREYGERLLSSWGLPLMAAGFGVVGASVPLDPFLTLTPLLVAAGKAAVWGGGALFVRDLGREALREKRRQVAEETRQALLDYVGSERKLLTEGDVPHEGEEGGAVED